MINDPALIVWADQLVVLVANLYNLLLASIFLSRPRGMKRLERMLGLFGIGLGIPLTVALITNLRAGRAWWFWFLPGLLLAFMLVELLLDYILRIEFRQTRLLGPYLLLYYAALMGMIGYAFQVRTAYGFATLGTYFISLLATWYSYSRVGHGRG
jgi:hypothetical protein